MDRADELVTTALLGTDRRPGTSPEALLEAAARSRAVHRVTAPLDQCPAPARAPAATGPRAPEAAQRLLGELLVLSVAELVTGWLRAAAAHRVLAGAEHWTALAELATARPDLDRRLLARALGRRGSWFLEQNPAWRPLAEAVRRAQDAPPPAAQDPTGGAGAAPAPAELRARPEAVFAVPAPWPREVSVAALQALLGGRLGWRAPAYGAQAGARIALGDHDLLTQAEDALPLVARGTPQATRSVADGLAAVRRSADGRAALEASFGGPGAAPAPPQPQRPPADHAVQEDR